MNDDGRLVRLETETGRLRSDVQDLRGSVDGVKAELSTFRETVATEFGRVRAEMEKGFGSLRSETASLRAEMEKGFGSIRADTAKEFGAVRTEMATQFGVMSAAIERNTRWLLVGGLGAAATLITMFATVAHALKWF